MKTKFFLFVSLVLLAVQGWALPVDSLDTPSSGYNLAKQWNGVELASGFVQTGLDTKGKVFQDDVSLPFLVIGGDVSVDPCYVEFPSQMVGTSTYQTFRIYENSSHGHISVEMIDTTGMFSIEKIGTVDNSYSYSVPQYTFNNGIMEYAGSSTVYVERIYTEWQITYTPMLSGIHKTSVSIKKENFWGTSYDEVAVVEIRGVAANPPTPEISVNPSLYDFGTAYKDDVKTVKLAVKGTNLTGDLCVTPSSSSYFTVSPTTITAAQAQSANGEEIMVTYNPKAVGTHSATFTISGGGALPETFSVSGSCELPPPPTITVDQTPLNFGTVNLGDDPKTKTITVKGTNLASDLNLSISGASGSMFTALPYRISPADAAAGRPVVVTYKPTAVGTHTATLVITGGGVDPVEISLSGKCLPALESSIAVDPSTYDFGTVKEGTTNTAIFTVTGTNLSDRIVLTWPQEDGFTITPTDLPASGGKVTVTFKPTSGGNYSQQYTLSSGNTSAKITVTGKCAAATTNKSALYFGSARKGETKTQTFKITGVNLTHDLTLTSSDTTLFMVSPSKITAAQAKVGKEVTVTYKPKAYVDHCGTITISGQDIKTKSVSLSGKCANITVSPSSYDFGTKTKGQTYTKKFTVTGTNLSQRISIVSTYGEGFTVSPTDLPATGGTVTVTFKPTSAGSSYSQEFKCSSDLTTTFSVTGKSGTPSISVNPSSLHFTTASSQTLTVTGFYLTGNITLKSNQAPFTVSPTTLPPSGGTVTVTCNANNFLNSATGSITIKSDGATTRTVPLTYTAGPGPLEIYSVKPYDEQENIINSGELEISTICLGGICSDMDDLSMAFKVYAEGLSIIIESPVQQKALISDIAGHVREVDLQTGRNEVPVNSSGIYFVRIREKSTKLMLK